ncbi:MAG: hypothetical protein AAB897_00375 [Patescibacteria group bacterium]
MKGMFDTFTSSGESQKAEFALKRNGYTRDQFERLIAGDFLGLVRELADLPLEFVGWLAANLSFLRLVYDGKAEIVRIERLSPAVSRKSSPSTETYTIRLGGPKTTDQIVKGLKKEGFWVNDLITQKNFPLQPHDPEDVEIEIIDPGKSFTEEEGLRLLAEAGLKRPTHEHALRFAEQFGKRTTGKKPFIIFLHEPWRDPYGDRRVIYVRRRPAYRELSLDYAVVRWDDDCVLAGVRPRKQTSES